MWSILDAIGATAIGGMVVLLVITINLQMNSLSADVIENTFVQASVKNSTEVFKYDLYKIGYRSSSDKLLLADSNAVKYTSDIDNNGSADTVYYHVSMGADSTYYLYRNVNGTGDELITNYSDFNLQFYDSSGSIISYSLLSTPSGRNKVRSLKVRMTVSTFNESNEDYIQTDLSTIINPKNLR